MPRLFLVVGLLVVLASAFAFSSSSSPSQSQEEWERFKFKFGKMYESPEEEKKRFGIFQENLRLFELRKDSYHPATKVGVTKFYDLTIEEWKERYFRPMGPAITAPTVIQRKQIQNKRPFPKTWDWTQKGVVTPVKNEEQCGSTWAMAALDVLESVCKIAGYPLISLSVQQVVDCDTNGYDQGCNGGFPQGALNYIISAGGIEPASDYPYEGQNNNCTANSKKFVECKPTSYINVTIGTGEQGLQEFVYTQSPVIICIDAAQNAFYDYTGGVITGADCSATSADHCVALEGWDFIDGQSAWKIKNQWGTDWGVEGYAYFQIGANTCGMDNPYYTIAPCVGKVC